MGERVSIATKSSESYKRNSVTRKLRTNYSPSISSFVENILFLERTMGNQVVQRLIKAGVIQARLKSGQPNDIYDQAADRVVDEVKLQPDSGIQMKPTRPFAKASSCWKEEKIIQSKKLLDRAPEVTSDIELDSNALIGGRYTLSESARSFFPLRLARGCGDVREHSDVRPAESARAVKALVYTGGTDTVFGGSQCGPASVKARGVLPHELAHSVQQRTTRHWLQRQGPGSTVPTTAELESRIIKVQEQIDGVKTDQDRTAAEAEALKVVRELENILAQVSEAEPYPHPSKPQVRRFITRIASTLFHKDTHFRRAVVKIAKGGDPEVQSTIIEKYLAPSTVNMGTSTVTDEQRFLEELASIAQKPLTPKAGNQTSAAWLEARTAQIGAIFQELDKKGLVDSGGRPIGMTLSSSLMRLFFDHVRANITPNPLGHVGGLRMDPTSQRLQADCDLLATYAVRLLHAQGYIPIGYMVIIPGGLDAHVVALLKRGAGDEYLGVSNFDIEALGAYSQAELAMPKLRDLAFTAYGHEPAMYKAYYLVSPSTGQDAGRYDMRLLHPARHQLTPVYQRP